METIPLIVNVGAQKAGTSWLFKCLEEHPAICVARGKETHFFSSTHAGSRNDSYKNNYAHYKTGQVLFESSTSYLYDKSVARKIRTYNPETKIIIILRDPIQRTLSHVRHFQSKAKHKYHSIHEVLSTEPTCISNSDYEKHIETYEKVYKEEQVLYLDYRDIAERPQMVIDEVCDFIGVYKFSPKTLNKKYNSSLARSHPIYRILTKYYLALSKTFIGRLLINTLKTLGINSISIEGFLRRLSKPLTEQTDSTIEEQLAKATEFYEEFSTAHSLSNTSKT